MKRPPKLTRRQKVALQPQSQTENPRNRKSHNSAETRRKIASATKINPASRNIKIG